MATPLATPRRTFGSTGSSVLAETPRLGPGGCPYEATVPKWLKEKKSKCVVHEDHPSVVFVLGGPGAGKGTQCRRIAEGFRYVHFSMGDLLRQERSCPEFGEVINDRIMQGKDVPSDVVVKVLMKAIEHEDNWKRGRFLIDGFPRDLAQIEAFNKIMGKKVVVKSCLYLDAAESTLERRLLALADSEHARDDDTVEIIHKRVQNYRKEVCPVQEYFQYEGLFERIDANRDIDKVWHDVQQYFVIEAYHDLGHDGDPTHGSPVKAVWKLRDKQCEEIFPSGHSHTSTNFMKGGQARGFTSYQILARHRDKHTRNIHAPTDHFTEPMTLAQEIGWHQPDDGEHIGAKGTPRGMDNPRLFYPRNTCAMTRHMENMYSTNAQHIIRRW